MGPKKGRTTECVMSGIYTSFAWLNLVMVVRFTLMPILSAVPAASKVDAAFNSGQKRLESNHLVL
jgi:hypothetical protein